VHPSAGENPPGPTTTEPFAPEALYELKIDTDGDAVADIAYRVRFSAFKRGPQTAFLYRVDGPQAAGTGDGGRVIVDGVPIQISEVQSGVPLGKAEVRARIMMRHGLVLLLQVAGLLCRAGLERGGTGRCQPPGARMSWTSR
jgi:hypothetical protein